MTLVLVRFITVHSMKITSSPLVLGLALMGCQAFADGVYVAPPSGGYSDPADPVDGIEFGSSYYIAPGVTGLTYGASENFFTGSISLVGVGGGLATLSCGSIAGDLDIYVSRGINTQWLTLQIPGPGSAPHLRLGGTSAAEIEFGSGLASPDTVLARSASGVLQINGQTIVTENSLGNYVTLTGAQTLSGSKTFSGTTTLGGSTAAQQVVIDNTGKIGVGSAPTGKFSIVTSSQPGRQVIIGAADGADSLMTVRGDDNGIARIKLQNLATNASVGHGFGLWTYFGTTSSTSPILAGVLNVLKESEWTATGTTQNSTMTFTTAFAGSTTEKMRISSAGNLGIGTTAPASRLHIVDGSGAVRIETTTADATTKFGRFVIGHYTNSEEPVMGFHAQSAGTENWVNIGGGSTIFNTANFLSFYTAANNTTLMGTERMRIVSNGNIGIGTSSPTAKLDVNGTVQIAGDVKVKNNAVIRISAVGDIPMIANPVGINPAN